MKYLNYLLIISLFSSPILAGNTPLSDESKEAIATSAITGGIFGLTAVGVNAGINFIRSEIKKEDLKTHAVAATLTSVATSLIFGLITYYKVPEKKFDYAKKTLTKISQEDVISRLYQSKSDEWIQILKNKFCNNRFPLSAAHEYLIAQYYQVLDAKAASILALNAKNAPFKQEAQELSEYADTTTMLLQAVLSQLNDHADLLNERATKAKEDTAIAMQTVAISQAIQALTPPKQQVIYIKNNGQQP